MRADCGPCNETFKDGWSFGAGGCPRGTQLRQELASFVRMVTQLEAAMNQLPRVDETGQSECHFAEDLYAEKERLEQAVLSDMMRFSGYHLTLEKWVEQCKKNMEKIESDSQRLHHSEPQDCYSDAANQLRGEYRLAVQDKDAVYVALEKAKAVLQVSSTRKFPGREPKKRTFAPVAQAPPSDTSHANGHAADLGGEVENVFSLGPIDTPGTSRDTRKS